MTRSEILLPLLLLIKSHLHHVLVWERHCLHPLILKRHTWKKKCPGNVWSLPHLELFCHEKWVLWVLIPCRALLKSWPPTWYLLDPNLFWDFPIFLTWDVGFVGYHLSNMVWLCNTKTSSQPGLYTQFFQSLISGSLEYQDNDCLWIVKRISERFWLVKVGEACQLSFDILFSFWP